MNNECVDSGISEIVLLTVVKSPYRKLRSRVYRFCGNWSNGLFAPT
jgi:hypothetical protein